MIHFHGRSYLLHVQKVLLSANFFKKIVPLQNVNKLISILGTLNNFWDKSYLLFS